MGTVLGLLGLVVFMAAIVGFAAGLTWLTVKISPTRDKAEKKATAS